MEAAPPEYGNGRHIDPEIGELSGEGAQQRVRPAAEASEAAPPEVWRQNPVRHWAAGEIADYYRRPVIREPVWGWSVPLYLYLGGVAAAASVLAAVLQARGGCLPDLARRCRTIGLAGTILGAGCLAGDLGRPGRSHHLLRVMRPTSPMSVGAWLLAAAGGALTASCRVRGSGAPGRLERAAGFAAGAAGIPLAGYTGVLLGSTAVPLWNEARCALPPFFTGSGVASLAALLEMTPLDVEEEKAVQLLSAVGKGAELAGLLAVERAAARLPEVVRPLREGVPGLLWLAGTVASAAGTLVTILPVRSPVKRVLCGLLGTAGALLLRFALLEAGRESARDSKTVFERQRRDV